MRLHEILEERVNAPADARVEVDPVASLDVDVATEQPDGRAPLPQGLHRTHCHSHCKIRRGFDFVGGRVGISHVFKCFGGECCAILS